MIHIIKRRHMPFRINALSIQVTSQDNIDGIGINYDKCSLVPKYNRKINYNCGCSDARDDGKRASERAYLLLRN